MIKINFIETEWQRRITMITACPYLSLERPRSCSLGAEKIFGNVVLMGDYYNEICAGSHHSVCICFKKAIVHKYVEQRSETVAEAV
jgi:hypothetical protein